MVKIGLEIHQQLDTGKLFCSCSGELSDTVDFEFSRKLRPVISEFGKVDRAALLEARRGRTAHYIANRETSCAVEWDEEPPHSPNKKAIYVATQIAKALGAKLIDEVQVMRKILIDGSAVSGFQRTALIATGGKVGKIGIETVCLEEDSARPVKGKFSLDRLGIPLVEIATAPDIKSGEEARDVAYKIGAILRMAHVKRGLGTIRQDLNISIPEGARVEIKGVQDPDLMPLIVEKEVERQKSIVRLKPRLNVEFGEIKEIKIKTENRILKKGKVYGRIVEGARGLFAEKLHEGKHLGKELAQYVKSFGFGGFFHTDEGKLKQEFEQARKQLKGKENDLILMAAGSSKILELVEERVKQLAKGVSEDTRKAEEDGSTTYLRPLPTGARMYPETDIPPFTLPEVEDLEMPEERLSRLEKELPKEIALKLYTSSDYYIFKELGGGKLLGVILTEHLPALRRKGVSIKKAHIEKVLKLVEKKELTEDGVFDALETIGKGKKLEIRKVDLKEVEKFVKVLVKEKQDYIKSAPDPIKGLMGIVMGKFRGAVPAKTIIEILKKELK